MRSLDKFETVFITTDTKETALAHFYSANQCENEDELRGAVGKSII